MNFQELAQKIRRIDEGAVVECGEMMPAHAPMPQQDTVSMNVSMNATGKGGIRDLMQVLQNIEDGVTHGSAPSIVDITPSDMHIDSEPDMDASMMGGEVEVEPEFGDDDGHEEIVFGTDEEPEFGDDEQPEMEPEFDAPAQDEIDPKIKHAIAPVVQAVGLAHALGKDPSKVFGGDKMTDEEDLPMPTDSGSEDLLASEEFANRPNAKYQSQNYMSNTLAQGSDEPQRMVKHSYRSGDNPMAMKEGLQDRLANLYQTVKLRESAEKKTMSRAAKGNEKYGKKGMQALAKAGREGKSLEPIKAKYNKYD